MIDLTTDYNTADFDGVYTHVQCHYFSVGLDKSTATIGYRYGTTLEGNFIPGAMAEKSYKVQNIAEPADTRWDDFKALLSNDGEASLDAVCRSAEQLLIDDAICPGTWTA